MSNDNTPTDTTLQDSTQTSTDSSSADSQPQSESQKAAAQQAATQAKQQQSEQHEEETPEQRQRRLEYEQLFEEEMLPHIRSLYHFAYRLTSDEDESNDLVQDTYLKAFRFIASYEKGSNAKAWLFRILKNSFINNYRKQSKEPNKVDYEEAETFLNTGKSTSSETIDLRDKIYGGLIGDEVSRAISTLPPDFRTVIILCDIEEFTYEEIAKIIDIPIGTVRSRLHRARNMLREMLVDYAMKMGYEAE